MCSFVLHFYAHAVYENNAKLGIFLVLFRYCVKQFNLATEPFIGQYINMFKPTFDEN